MSTLAIGVLLLAGLHLFSAAAPGLRQRLIVMVGPLWKGLFALANGAAIYLMVLGWKAAIPLQVFVPPAWAPGVGSALALAGFILFFAPYLPNNFRRLLRHPQLTGLLCWCLGHALANGDSRSLLLFGGLGVWGLLEMLALNRRDGAWQRPAAAPLWGSIVLVAAGTLVGLVIAWLHLRWFGVMVIPGP